MRAQSYGGKTAKVSRSSPQNNLGTITNKYDKEIPKEIYISRRKTENDYVIITIIIVIIIIIIIITTCLN